MPVRRTSKPLTIEEAILYKYDPDAAGYTQSLLGSFMCCPLRGMLSAHRWSNPKKANMTGFGSLVHYVLEHWQMEDGCNIKECIATYAKKHGSRLGARGTEDLEFLKTKAQVVLEAYSERYAKEQSEMRGFVSEGVFEFEGRRGKIDGSFRDKNRKPWLMETKTMSRVEEDNLLLHLSFDFQNLFYMDNFEQSNNVKVHGVLYNMIRQPQLKLKAGESLKQYGDRVAADIESRPDFYFIRMHISYTRRDIQRFRDELKFKVARMRDFTSGTIPVYRNEFACKAPFPCEFLQACASGHMSGYVQKELLFEELEAE